MDQLSTCGAFAFPVQFINGHRTIEDWAWDLVTLLELVCSFQVAKGMRVELCQAVVLPAPTELALMFVFYPGYWWFSQPWCKIINFMDFCWMISFWFHWFFSPAVVLHCFSPLLVLRTASPRWGERTLLLSFLLVSSCDGCLLLTHPGRDWRASKVKLACGRLICRELSWSLIIVRRPSPLWVEASLGGLNKKARGWWARVWNSKPRAYTLQVQFLSDFLPWLPLMTNLWPVRWTDPFPTSCRKGPGIFGPGVYQNKGHSVFSPCLLCWWKAHLSFLPSLLQCSLETLTLFHL